MNYSLLDIIACFNHNGDYEAAQKEIDLQMAEDSYVRETPEEIKDYLEAINFE